MLLIAKFMFCGRVTVASATANSDIHRSFYFETSTARRAQAKHISGV